MELDTRDDVKNEQSMLEKPPLSSPELLHYSSPGIASSPANEQIQEHLPDSTVERPPARPDGKSKAISQPVWVIIILSILSSVFLFALDNTIVADIQPKIIERFNGIEKLPWLSVAFALGAGSVNLVWGKIYGEFNCKPIFIAAIFIFEVGSAICGAAPSMNAMIVGRAIAGVGGGGIYIGAINLLTASTPISQRPLYMSFVGATWSSGTVLGPIVGGAFVESRATWRWAFYINLCVAAVAAPAYFLLLPSPQPNSTLSTTQRIRKLDFLGIILFVGAFLSLIMGIAFGGAIYAWNSGQIIGLFVCSGILFILFGVQQFRSVLTTDQDRLFPVQFLRSHEMCILFAQIAACSACIFIPVYFIPLFFQFVRSDSALEAGVRLLPFVCVGVFGAMVNGAVMERYGLYMPWFTIGGVLVTIGGSLLYTIDINTSAGRVYGYSVITALGTGSFVQAPFSVAQAKVEAHQVPAVTAFISCGQITGITLSLSIATTVFVNEASNKIAVVLPNAPRSLVRATIAGADVPLFRDQSAVDQARILEAIVSTIDHAWVMVIVGGVLATLLSIPMKRERLFLKAGAPIG